MNTTAAKATTCGTKKLSLVRVVVAFAFIIGVGYVGREYVQQKHIVEEVHEEAHDPWFAAYADVVSVPRYSFEQLGATSTKDVILSFIVSSAKEPCVPSWGSDTTMDEASIDLDLDRRIARLRQQGGKIAVSFGGAINTELSVSCKDNDQLYSAYNAVITRYDLDTIDLDIEGQALRDIESIERRAVTIARLQKDYQDKEKNLAVWLTVPVSPQGLTQEGVNFVAHMLLRGVDIAGINVMTMNYGESRQGKSMVDSSLEALMETHRQLKILYAQAGIHLSDASLWTKIGATPMIGQNDIADEVFTVEDAKAINAFAMSRKMGRMSMWSANRDTPCGENYVDVKVVSDSCSGVKDAAFSFAQALHVGFDGSFEQSAGIRTVSDPESNVVIEDDPQSSPYQIWKPTGAYPKGVKVVWHGNVYEAKWWTKNDLPDHPVLQAWETPWRLVGPVLPGEKPIEQLKLPDGTYPTWAGGVIYDGGDRVLFEGSPFQAKWWNQGESPAASAANPDNSPWIPLTQSQINEILGNKQEK